MRHLSVILLALASCLPGALGAADAASGVVVVDLSDLTITEGALKVDDGSVSHWWEHDGVQAVARLDGPGEVAVEAVRHGDEHRLAVRATPGTHTGTLWMPNEAASTLHRVRFTVEVPADSDAADGFAAVRRAEWQARLRGEHAGAAWWRHGILAGGGQPEDFRERDRDGDVDEMIDLFSGGRALAENLRLEGGLPELPTVLGEAQDFAAIPGITVAEMEWAPLVAGLPQPVEPLAAVIPADQHAVLFPSFAALLAVIDGGDLASGSVIRGLSQVAQDGRLAERYQRQLCLEPSAAARLLGGQLIDGVAITGGDPALALGADVAVLFHGGDPAALMALLAARQLAVVNEPGVQAAQGEVAGRAWRGVVSSDRRRSAYLADLGGGRVVVTNSLAQLARLAAVADGTEPALGATPEFRFFHARHHSADGALVVLSDATIRRWCGPRQRIADARRVRALAALSELQATWLDHLPAQEQPLADAPPELGAVTVGPRGVRSARYGTLGFMTPVAELDLGQALATEVAAYGRFRDSYQARWRGWFDPIGARLTVDAKHVSADLTVMPLIAGSEYRELIGFTAGGKLLPGAGDPHPQALLQIILAVDRKARQMEQAKGFLTMSEASFGDDPLAWFDGAVSLSFDADPFWQELGAAPEAGDFLEQNLARLPVALYLGVGDGLRLAGFLVAAHAYIDRTAPGLVRWENERIGGVDCVRLSPAKPGEGPLEGATVYILPGKGGVLVSLNRGLIERAVQRQSVPLPAPAVPPLGEQVVLHLGEGVRDLFTVFAGIGSASGRDALRMRSWRNLAILNEWKRLFPTEDPVAVHERLWHVRLVCPAGGTYVWNDAVKSMESTVVGCPEAPKEGPAWSPLSGVTNADFGLTFEHGGLRARAEIVRSE